jgi:amino acid permease
MSTLPQEPPPAYRGAGAPEYGHEETAAYDDKSASPVMDEGQHYDVQEGGQRALSRALKGRHMQMIAIG